MIIKKKTVLLKGYITFQQHGDNVAVIICSLINLTASLCLYERVSLCKML